MVTLEKIIIIFLNAKSIIIVFFSLFFLCLFRFTQFSFHVIFFIYADLAVNIISKCDYALWTDAIESQRLKKTTAKSSDVMWHAEHEMKTEFTHSLHFTCVGPSSERLMVRKTLIHANHKIYMKRQPKFWSNEKTIKLLPPFSGHTRQQLQHHSHTKLYEFKRKFKQWTIFIYSCKMWMSLRWAPSILFELVSHQCMNACRFDSGAYQLQTSRLHWMGIWH